MVKLSNSAAESYWTCPQLYFHRYVSGWQRGATPPYLLFGTRMHELLQGHYSGATEPVQPPTGLSPELELEAQALFESYKAQYPQEDFEVVSCEQYFELPVTSEITYVGRIDMLVRDRLSGTLRAFETKTESRGSKRNHPQAWAIRHQASLYVWAASQVFGEKIDSVILNVLTRGTPGKRIGPGYRRDLLHRTPEQIEQALSDLRYVGENIARLSQTYQYDYGDGPGSTASVYTHRFPRNTMQCVSEKGWQCDMYNYCWLGSNEGLVQLSNPYEYLES